jgi:hypothetical protein
MRVTRLRAGFSAVLLLSGLAIGGLVTAPSASALPTLSAFESSDFATWDSTNSSPFESFIGNIGSTFTVGFPTIVVTCANSIITPTSCAPTPSQMTIESSAAAVTPSSGVISSSSTTSFTVVRSGTLTLTPVLGVACSSSCAPLTIVITAVGPKNFVSSDCLVWNSNGQSYESITGYVGETFTVTFPNLVVATRGVSIQRLACPNFLISGSPVTATPTSGTIDSSNALTFTITGSGKITLTQIFAPLSISGLLQNSLTISVTALTADAPPDLLQQVGASNTGSCSAFVDATLNWAGAPSGGWATSWAQWMNQGKGGAVCTRSLYWLPSGRWSVRE